uniref:Uncharacterized protein n=1 Tax=Fervidobacterium pennivorans TaxID=93466 RepID=A0A7C4RYH6_FERPE
MSVELVEVLKSLKESFEKTEKMIDILEESGFSIKDVHQALPTFIALMAMGVKKDSKEALRYIDLLCDSAKEIIEKFFCKER